MSTNNNNNQPPSLYPFQDGLLSPPKIGDNFNKQYAQKHINYTLAKFPEQVEQELALFAYEVLDSAKTEYSGYADFKKKNPPGKKTNINEIKNLAQKRMCLLEMQLANLQKVTYLAENYQEKKDEKNEEEEENGINEEEEEYEDE